MSYSSLIAKAETYVKKYIKEHPNPKIQFHTLEHTEKTVQAAKQLAKHYQLDEHDHFIVVVSAWFSAIGYYVNPEEYQKEGTELAAAFLKKNKVAETDIIVIRACLFATQAPQSPANKLEQIVCDAVSHYLVSSDYLNTLKVMRKEKKALHQTKLDKAAWQEKAFQMLASHQFHTDFYQEHQSKMKQHNMDVLNKKVEKQKKKNKPGPAELQLQELAAAVKKIEDKAKVKKNDRPDRTIETMFRVTTTNSQRLSDQADSKANIMISVNSFLIPAAFFLLRDVGTESYLTIPLTILLSVSLLTMIFAVLATRPQIPKGVFTQEDLANKKVDLLFFGNFYQMDFDVYSNGMFTIMEDRYHLHLTLLRDIYSQGLVLGRKYRMLTFSYNIFMFGLILTVLSFFVALKYMAG